MNNTKINIKGSQLASGIPFRSGANSRAFQREKSGSQFFNYHYVRKGISHTCAPQ